MKRDELPMNGDRVRDRISGLKGIVIGVHDWLFGCRRITIQPEEVKDGKPAEGYCVDSAQCEVLKRAAIEPPQAVVAADVRARPAGPRSDASRGHNAKR